MSISAIFLSFAFEAAHAVRELGQVPYERCVARPGAVFLKGEDPRVRARLENRTRDQRPGRNLDMVRELDVAGDHRRATNDAVLADVRTARDAGAGGDRGMRADAHVVPDLDLVESLTPSSITVSPSAPRSMVVLAPIS